MKILAFPALLLLLIGAIMAAIFVRVPVYYPQVVVQVSDELKLEFLRKSRVDQNACKLAAYTIADAVRTTCPACKNITPVCLTSLTPDQHALLTGKSVPIPSSSLRDGYVAYVSNNASTALEACREAERQTSRATGNRAPCFGPHVSRSEAGSGYAFSKLMLGLPILLLSGLAAFFVGFLVIRYENVHSRWSHDSVDGPQKFHVNPTPRIGGLCLMAGLCLAGMLILALERTEDIERYGYLMLASLPAFFGGITEDVTKNVSVRVRLVLTMLAASLGAWFIDASLPRLDVPGLDLLLVWTPAAIVFTVFAVGGVANAVNIIDGYNGLAGGYIAVVLLALAYVSADVGDVFLFYTCLAMFGGLLGFLFWNYPKGRIFLGDGGAYLLGFWVAEISVLLVARHPDVSPWFPLALLIYPVFETIYSVYRRKLMRGGSPGLPDRLHLHQLIYSRLVKGVSSSGDALQMTRRNSMVAPYIWALAMALALPAVLWWNRTLWLELLAVGFCITYAWLYHRIVSWRVPSCLIRRDMGR